MTFRQLFILLTNTWSGKIIGAFFGYLVAGPTGALFGLLIGNIFDRGLTNYFTNPHWVYYSEKREEAQKIFFEATFSVLGYLSKADGRVTERELDMARMLMDEMHLTNEQKKAAKLLFNEGKKPAFKLNIMLLRLQQACKNKRDLLRLFLDIQYRMAQVDGFNSKKVHILDSIFSNLGFMPFHKQHRFYSDFGGNDFQEQNYNTNQRAHTESNQSHSSSSQQSHSYSSYKNHTYQQSGRSSLDYAYALLEIKPNATKQEVKRAYRRLLSRNHPDKLIAQGLPPEMIKLANEKTQKIVKAYESICTSKGW